MNIPPFLGYEIFNNQIVLMIVIGGNMSINNYIFFISKRSNTNRFLKILFYTIIIVCFSLFSFTITFFWLFHRAYKDINSLLPTGIENAAVINYTGTTSIPMDNSFLLKIIGDEDVRGIASIGTYFVNPNFYHDGKYIGDKIVALSNNGLHNFIVDENIMPVAEGIECLSVSSATVDFFDFQLYKGSFENIDSNTTIYLGYNYKDIPIGTVLKTHDYSGNELEFKVAGILEKNCSIIDSQSCANSYTMQVNFKINLDNMMLSVERYDDKSPINRSGPFIVSFNDGVGYDEGIKKIYDIADSFNDGNRIIIMPASLEEKVQHQLSEYDILLNLAYSLIPVSFFITFIIILSVQLILVFIRKDEIGVWLSNGFTRRNVFWILFFENMFKFFIASIITSIIFCIYIKNQLMLSEAVEHFMFFDIYVFAPLCLIIISLILSGLISAISYNNICNKSLPDIIKSTWE